MERWRRDGEGSRQSQDLFELENESDVDDDIAYSRRWRSNFFSTLAIFCKGIIKDKDLKFIHNKDKVFSFLKSFSLSFFVWVQNFLLNFEKNMSEKKRSYFPFVKK